VVDWWRRYELGRDSVTLAQSAGAMAAFGVLGPREDGVAELHGYIRPGLTGRGLGGFLLDWAEREARRRGAARLRASVVRGDSGGRALFEQRGFVPVRRGYRMVIDLAGEPPAPSWPAGFSVEPLRLGEERVLYEVLEEAFAEEWGRPHRSFEEWQRSILAMESFDPGLCFLVRRGDEMAAAETCSLRFGIGWIGSIGVLKPWRRRGLGRALLLHSFGELYRRGEARIGLGVDAENPTGATRLYESVGMRVAWQADAYEKTL
jgi:mycothiol synthase